MTATATDIDMNTQIVPCTNGGAGAGRAHRWLLEPPRDGAIAGVCRRCGATRTFPSYIEENNWRAHDRMVFGSSAMRSAIDTMDLATAARHYRLDGKRKVTSVRISAGPEERSST